MDKYNENTATLPNKDILFISNVDVVRRAFRAAAPTKPERELPQAKCQCSFEGVEWEDTRCVTNTGKTIQRFFDANPEVVAADFGNGLVARLQAPACTEN